MTLRHEQRNLFRIDVSGRLRRAELDGCQRSLAGEMDRIGPVRLLFLLHGFEGWEPGAGWNDLSFFVKHGPRIERMAIVGDERWRSESLMFAGADLRAAAVEFFVPEDVDRARVWLFAEAPVDDDRAERNVS